MDITNQIKRAYKKLKSSVYYDKTQSVLRNDIVEFESKGINHIEKKFIQLSKILNSDEAIWKNYEKKIIESIKALTYPKKFEEVKESIVINDSNCELKVLQEQYFIHMDTIGHLLGVLWILYIGKYIDEDIYECSYGNRLSEKLVSEETGLAKFSVNLFKPYYTQYESWRDYALEKAQENLKNSKDVVMLTMDFTKFFYSIHFEKQMFEGYIEQYSEEIGIEDDEELSIIVKRLNDFVYNVLLKYSSLFKKKYNKRVFLPIGFLPSNILSNGYLKTFDSAIINRWNPVYYGRYVDDIIIVDKVEKNSILHDLVSSKNVNPSQIIEYFLCKCNADKVNKCPRNAYFLNDIPKKHGYYVNNAFFSNSKAEVQINDDKLKVFYFKHEGSDSLLTKFKKEIAENKSEFRYMPEDENILESGDYSEIFELEYSSSINKISGVKGITIDKYELSKFLGKYQRVGGLINDKKESKFIEDILRIFNERVVIENYTLWEKIIEILIVENKFSVLEDFISLILKSISKLIYINLNGINTIQLSLINVLYTGICRGFSLSWGSEVKNCINVIYDLVKQENIKGISNILYKFSYGNILKFRQGYCITRMVDKNTIPALIDVIIGNDNFEIFSDNKKINLTVFNELMEHINDFNFENVNYYYYPYIISPQELQLSSVFCKIKDDARLNNDSMLENPEKHFNFINRIYYKLNFNIKNSSNGSFIDEVDIKSPIETDDYSIFAIKVGREIKKDKVKIALANVKLDEQNFIDVLTSIPSRSYERYKNLASVVREAIKNNVDMLVLPEAYLPIEWLPIIMSISARTQMAIVTGIEHVVNGKSVYNFTATILPYKYQDFKFAYINMHCKVVYSPEEKFVIEGYRYKCVEGKNHELFVWNNIWFPVFCCFEFADIQTRAKFQSIADLVVTIEWNHDINYFSSIIESLNRDLHCYCVQVNTSDFGDSRLVKPSKTENKDIIRIKGGVNSTALIDEIDIKVLRDFQIKEYGLQKLDKTFKPTPPFFSPEIVDKKRRGILWSEIDNILKSK